MIKPEEIQTREEMIKALQIWCWERGGCDKDMGQILIEAPHTSDSGAYLICDSCGNKFYYVKYGIDNLVANMKAGIKYSCAGVPLRSQEDVEMGYELISQIEENGDAANFDFVKNIYIGIWNLRYPENQVDMET